MLIIVSLQLSARRGQPAYAHRQGISRHPDTTHRGTKPLVRKLPGTHFSVSNDGERTVLDASRRRQLLQRRRRCWGEEKGGRINTATLVVADSARRRRVNAICGRAFPRSHQPCAGNAVDGHGLPSESRSGMIEMTSCSEYHTLAGAVSSMHHPTYVVIYRTHR